MTTEGPEDTENDGEDDERWGWSRVFLALAVERGPCGQVDLPHLQVLRFAQDDGVVAAANLADCRSFPLSGDSRSNRDIAEVLDYRSFASLRMTARSQPLMHD